MHRKNPKQTPTFKKILAVFVKVINNYNVQYVPIQICTTCSTPTPDAGVDPGFGNGGGGGHDL